MKVKEITLEKKIEIYSKGIVSYLSLLTETERYKVIDYLYKNREELLKEQK